MADNSICARNQTVAEVKEMMDAVERRHGYEFFDKKLADAYSQAVADKVQSESDCIKLVNALKPLREAWLNLAEEQGFAPPPSGQSSLDQLCGEMSMLTVFLSHMNLTLERSQCIALTPAAGCVDPN
tara:strand:+ start:9087 stop:9467 length:381 start_codon:yes stop_codon:yes gene_type:complete